MQTIRIGTRGSRLALWQAHYVADKLRHGGIASEIVEIETRGDKLLDVSIAKIGSKGVFTEELETQLREKEIDVAVHSAKDLPSTLPDDLEIIAFTEREAAHDVLISYNADLSLDNPTHPILIGTSSTRRRAMLKRFYPHVRMIEARGNLQTRMRKLADGESDGLILAYAGVHRMQMDEHIVAHLPLDRFTPPVGQGSIALETSRTLDSTKRRLIRELTNHSPTEACLRAERAFLKTLQGGCSIPVFGLATWEDDHLYLTGGVISLDGKDIVEGNQRGTPAQGPAMGHALAESLLAQGADRILADIRQHL